ncbi:uncharacterized protein LOC126898525 [Daktulosphaira vitifoliae]|uniref:uncharacterized protein LOC126898525 n=1 Tax=Daktulosphaira vitifoliae TaxID=58002 RepID=UPI0021AA6766|nr:uncharacterized protein LOC126898525 [Daktulosphaira vitifoliae]
MWSMLNVFILLTSFLHFSQTFRLLDLPNGDIMENEYLFCDDDNLLLADIINNGEVTMEQYYNAMQNRVYKYLYLLPYYLNKASCGLYEWKMQSVMIESLNYIIIYMKYHKIPFFKNLEELKPIFKLSLHTHYYEVEYEFDKFMDSIKPLFVFYHKSDHTYEVVNNNEQLLKKLNKTIISASFFKSLFKNGLEQFPPFIKYYNHEKNHNSVHKLIETIHNEYRIISKDTVRLLDLPNGEIMENEYLFCDDDNLRLGDILNCGQVTMEQYYNAMKNKAYKYLYFLPNYILREFEYIKPSDIKYKMVQSLKYVIDYMKHHKIPVFENLEQMIPKINSVSDDQTENFLTEFTDWIKSLFVFYHKNEKTYEIVNNNKELLKKLDEKIKSSVLFKDYKEINLHPKYCKEERYKMNSILLVVSIIGEYQIIKKKSTIYYCDSY